MIGKVGIKSYKRQTVSDQYFSGPFPTASLKITNFSEMVVPTLYHFVFYCRNWHKLFLHAGLGPGARGHRVNYSLIALYKVVPGTVKC